MFNENVVIGLPELGSNFDIKIIATNKKGCNRDTTFTIKLTENTAPKSAKVIKRNNNTLVCLDNSASSYQWGYEQKDSLISHPIKDAINQDYYSESGFNTNYYYWVKTTNAGGCWTKSYLEPINTGFSTDLDKNSQSGFDIYPNPNNGSFTLHFNQSNPNVSNIQIINNQGKQVYHYKILNSQISQDLNLSIPSVKPGIYIMIIYDGNGIPVTKKIVVH
jgi:hypothetical protein